MHLSVDTYSSLVEDKTMHCDPPDHLLDNFSLERIECFKCLEILLNSWSNHTASICTKGCKLLQGFSTADFINMQNHQHYSNPTWNTQKIWDLDLQKDVDDDFCLTLMPVHFKLVD